MESSILTSTKKLLGLDENYTVYDLDIIIHINSSFSTLNQLGIILPDDFIIEDDSVVWDDLDLAANILNMVKPYIFLNTKLLFDPPGTSFHITAIKEEIAKFEWRINVFREETLHPLEEVI